MTIVLIPLCLSGEEQGYYYTFASVLALQIFFELGMNQVVTQITSHEIAHLTWLDRVSVDGDVLRVDRLGSLAKMLRRWYLVAATLFAVAVGGGGALFFGRHGDLAQSRWLGPWIVMTIATAANLYLSPSLAILEGAGRIGEVARMRLYQSMAGYLAMAVALLSGAGLWSATLVPIATIVGANVFLRRDGRLVHWLRTRPLQSDAKVDWRREIFPFQWRIALSWISGYFIFQLFTPMLFRNQGAVQAGRFGMVLAIFNALQSIGMSWVYSKSPVMAQHISRGERAALRALFLRVLKPSFVFTLISSVAVVAVVALATRHGMAFVERLSSVEVVAFLALNTIVNSLIFAMAVFMRAHKEEPLMPQAVVAALLMLAIAHWASRVSVELTAALCLAVTVLMALPWSLIVFRRYWQRA
ncbi:MAG: hypothetical protein ACTHL8_13935 [Burkholderiaceae bacterium]